MTKTSSLRTFQAAVLSLAVPMVAQFEGLRTKAYLDTGGVPTICYGETDNVQLGDTATTDECKKLLTARLGYFSFQVDKLVTTDISPQTHAAVTSFTYNVGVAALKRSTLLRLLNQGHTKEACHQMMRWTYDNGKIYNGLINRRTKERDLCLAGIK